MNEEQVLSVGSYLRQERERRNISLESVAKVTRITLQNLEALERDDFRLLPAPVFTRGFLRTYAAYLGIDPKENDLQIFVSMTGAPGANQALTLVVYKRGTSGWGTIAVPAGLVPM